MKKVRLVHLKGDASDTCLTFPKQKSGQFNEKCRGT